MRKKKSTYTLEEAKRSLERYCAYQERCHWEIEKKLKEMGMIREACEHILLHLMEHDFLNEERYAKSFARGKFRIKKWGQKRIENELRQREISPYNIRSGLKEIPEDEYEETLLELSRKQFDAVKETNSLKKRKKVADFLLRKGYESQRIYEVITKMEKENNS